MNTSKTIQKDNLVAGDQAGRDIVKSQTNHHHYYAPPTQMSFLIQRYLAEDKTNRETAQFIDKLTEFNSCVDRGPVIGLDAKLRASGLDAQIDFASRTKEAFTKALVKHQLSETAQHIMAHLLADIFTRFERFVTPEILLGMDSSTIDSLVQDRVITPVRDALEDNVLNLYSDEINGMLYFLTGNCHINWRK
jgi:hypothetical protein